MARNTVGDWSTTASSNTDVGSINIAEGCAAANVNNALREIMAQIATLEPKSTTELDADYQPLDATLTSIAALGTAAGKLAYTTAEDTWAEADVTAAGLALLDDADAAAQRTTLGLGGLATLEILDEDDFASDSATRPPSQQSTKAYVDGDSAGPVATTSGSAIEFNSIPADVTEIEVFFNGISVSGTNFIALQLSSGGVYETTGYKGSCCRSNQTSVAQGDTTTSIPVTTDAPGPAVFGGMRLLKEPGSNFWIGSGLFTSGETSFETSGSIALAGVLDGVRIATSGANTFDAGQVSIKYKRRAS